MKKFFEEAIKNIEELINLRYKQIDLLNKLEKSQDSNVLFFKIKNYKLWIITLKKQMDNPVTISNKEDIINLKLSSKKLETHLIELLELGEFKDIDDTKNEIQELERQIALLTDSMTNSVNSISSIDNASNNDIEIDEKLIKDDIKKPIKKKIVMVRKSPKKDIEEIKAVGEVKAVGEAIKMTNEKKVDTTKIEAQPKILKDEIRPTDPKGAAMFDLRYVYGIGPKNAEKLVEQNITLEKLLEEWTELVKKDVSNAILMPSKIPKPATITTLQWNSLTTEAKYNIQIKILNDRFQKETHYLKKLNNHQIMGIKYFYDISQKIPRDEIQKAEHFLKASAKHLNPDIIVTLCGSYRRGRAASGDIDCLITHPEIKTSEELENYPINLLSKFVEFLTNLDFLVDHLTDNGKTKYMGFCIVKQPNKKNNTARRIDIRFIPFNSYGTAVLYFTGSKLFNTKMRAFALSKGYYLNEYGLKRLKDDVLILSKTEEEVFEILKYPYKTPKERDIE